MLTRESFVNLLRDAPIHHQEPKSRTIVCINYIPLVNDLFITRACDICHKRKGYVAYLYNGNTIICCDCGLLVGLAIQWRSKITESRIIGSNDLDIVAVNYMTFDDYLFMHDNRRQIAKVVSDDTKPTCSAIIKYAFVKLTNSDIAQLVISVYVNVLLM